MSQMKLLCHWFSSQVNLIFGKRVVGKISVGEEGWVHARRVAEWLKSQARQSCFYSQLAAASGACGTGPFRRICFGTFRWFRTSTLLSISIFFRLRWMWKGLVAPSIIMLLSYDFYGLTNITDAKLSSQQIIFKRYMSLLSYSII